MQNKLQSSLICTVKNESETITQFLDSICGQTLAPNEIVIVDGGSNDGTLDKIRRYQNILPIKIIVNSKANIATGRNIAIRNASYEIIVSTDAGCKLDKYFFENITRYLDDPKVDVVSGIYLPWTESDIELIMAELTFGDVDKTDPQKFLPSSRSIAFKKSCWKNVGGYPEWMDTAEDTFFDINLKNAGFKFALALNAVVYWRARKNVTELFRQYLKYSIGDGMARLSLNLFIGRVALICVLIILFVAGFSLNLYWLLIPLMIGIGLYAQYVRKLQKKSLSRITRAFGVAAIIECGSIIGYITGLLRRKKR